MFDKVVQICSVLEPGDGIGNVVRDYSVILSDYNIVNCIIAEHVNPSYHTPKLSIYHISALDDHITDRTLVIFHKSIMTDISYRVIELKCHKILLWHNMTPPEFFKPYNKYIYELAKKSIQEIALLAPFFPNSWGNSDYNCNELLKLGYKKAETLHFTYDFDRLASAKPSKAITKKKKGKNIIFVGRIVPNKRQEDVIRAFYYFYRLNPGSSLILIGSWSGFENYKDELVSLAQNLSLPVILPGKVSLNDLAAYYRTADLFLCMSEHEGLNIPLLEAMYFEVPVIAFNSSSISEGIGDGGIIFNQKHFPSIGHLMDIILKDSELIRRMKASGKKRINHFDKSHSASRLINLIEAYAIEMNIK